MWLLKFLWLSMISCHNGILTRYAKLRVAHAPGMPGTFSPPPNSKKPLASEPGMHHGTCVTHVPWCMSGSLTRVGGGNVSGIPGACETRNFAYMARGPLWTKWPPRYRERNCLTTGSGDRFGLAVSRQADRSKGPSSIHLPIWPPKRTVSHRMAVQHNPGLCVHQKAILHNWNL